VGGALLVRVHGREYVTLWRACIELAERHQASRWRLGRGRLVFSNHEGDVASYASRAMAGNVLQLILKV